MRPNRPLPIPIVGPAAAAVGAGVSSSAGPKSTPRARPSGPADKGAAPDAYQGVRP